MIFNDSNIGSSTYNGAFSYLPVDPKYVYRYFVSSDFNSYLSQPASDFSTGLSLDGLMQQRHQVLDSKIQLLTGEIYRRYEIEKDNLYRIDLDQCSCRYLICMMGEQYLDRRRIDLEKKMLDLEQEKRREITTTFKDVLFLKKELRDTLIESMEEKQKTALFMG